MKKAEQRQADGLADDEARRAARRELGNVTLVEENTRAAWGWTLLEQFGQDLRYAVRTMAANRLFTLLAVFIAGAGNRGEHGDLQLHGCDPAALAAGDRSGVAGGAELARQAGETGATLSCMASAATTYGDPKSGVTAGIFPYPAFELFRKHDAVFSTVFAHFQSWHAKTLNLAIKGQAGIASGVYVSGDYFRGLGVPPAAGRLILPDDDRPGAPAVAVVSYAFSQRRFGGAANAAGQAILIDNLPFTVVGVTPPEFFGVDPAAAPDVYLPMHANDQFPPGGLSGTELLLGPDHGPLASGSEPRASPGRTGAGVSSVGGSTATKDQERRIYPS